MSKINFCGDSFCADPSHLAWTHLVASQLGAQIIGYGKKGMSHEYAIQCFDPTADYTVFCWTEPHRIWHPTIPLNMARVEEQHSTSSIFRAAYVYYKFLFDEQYSLDRQMRDLYWFDHEILSKNKQRLIHLWGFNVNYTFTHGINIETPISKLYKTGAGEDGFINHLSIQDNELMAKLVVESITQ